MYLYSKFSWPIKYKSSVEDRFFNECGALYSLHHAWVICLTFILCLFFFVHAQTTTPNYVETTIYNVDGNNNNIVSRSYSDGLGRSIQGQTQINGKTSVIVTGTCYDKAGRPDSTAKPFSYPKSSANLDFIPGNVITGTNCANEYYNGTTAPDAGGYAFSEIKYYDDPLGRVSATGAPGKDFSCDGHPVKTWYFGVTGTCPAGDNYFDANGFLNYEKLTDILLTYDVATHIATLPSDQIAYYLTVTKDPNGHFAQVLTDIFGKTIRTWAKIGSASSGTSDEIVSSMSYDILGNVLKETPPSTSESTDVSPTKHAYNTLGQIVADTIPDKRTVIYTYYDNGLVHEILDSNSLSTESDRKECIITYAYDALNRNVRIADSIPAGSAGYSYIIRTRTRTIYDEVNAVRNYIANSAFSSLSESDLSALLDGLTNTRGRVVASIAYDNKFVSTGTVEADESNYKGKVIDLYSYDDEGRVNCKYKSIPGLPLQTEKFGYDLQGKIVADTIQYFDQATASSKTIYTKYLYDQNGRLESVTRDDKVFVHYTYDDLGKLIKKTFVHGTGTSGQDVTYDYNIRDWTQDITATGNPFVENITFNQSASVGPFDGNISRVEITTTIPTTPVPAGANLDLYYNYDNVNRLTGVISNPTNPPTSTDWANWTAASIKGDYDAKYSYLNDGRILQKHEGTDQAEWGNYVYQGTTNRLSHIDSATTQTHNHIYDNNGNMVFDLSKKMAVEYDWRNMPVKFTVFSSVTGTLAEWQDVVDYISNHHDLVTSEVIMTYDASGNRVKKEEVDYSAQQACTPPTTSDPGLHISYMPAGSTDPQSIALISPAGDLKTCLKVSSGDEINPIPGSALTFALLKGVSLVKTLSSFSDKEIQFGAPVVNSSTPNVTVGSFVVSYNSTAALVNNIDYVAFAGTLPEPIVNTGVAYVDGSHVFEKNHGADPYGLSYVNFADGISRPNNTFEYYLKDHLGSTRAVMVEDEEYGWMLKEAMAYLAYGAKEGLKISPIGERARRQFTDKELDEEAGIRLNYFGYRYYDPEIGAWTSTDPAEQFFNSYRYTTNPICFIDSKGQFDFGLYQGYQGYNLIQPITYTTDYSNNFMQSLSMDIGGFLYSAIGGSINLGMNFTFGTLETTNDFVNSIVPYEQQINLMATMPPVGLALALPAELTTFGRALTTFAKSPVDDIVESNVITDISQLTPSLFKTEYGQAVFYAGRNGLNLAAANASGGTTISMTKGGQALNKLIDWNTMSADASRTMATPFSKMMAEQASGPVRAWSGGASYESVWNQTELPTLMNNPEVTKIIIQDAIKTNCTKIIYPKR